MLGEIQSAIILNTQKVFETMFFTSVDLSDNGGEQKYPISTFPSLLRGEIGFQGKETGSLRIYLPERLALKMADNFLGMEKTSISLFELKDMVGELCNMICGNFLSYLDRHSVWSMNPPDSEIVTYETIEKEVLDNSATVFTLWVEGYEVKIAILQKNKAKR